MPLVEEGDSDNSEYFSKLRKEYSVYYDKDKEEAEKNKKKKKEGAAGDEKEKEKEGSDSANSDDIVIKDLKTGKGVKNKLKKEEVEKDNLDDVNALDILKEAVEMKEARKED